MTGAEILMGAMAAMSVAGGVVGAAGASQAASAAATAGNYNAAVLEQQAAAAERNREVARRQAELEISDQRVKHRALQGQIRAAYGTSGFAIDGRPLDVLANTAAEQELDIDKIYYKGDLQAAAETDKANSFRAQATLARMGAGQALTAGGYGIATNLLAGVTGAVKTYTPVATMKGT